MELFCLGFGVTIVTPSQLRYSCNSGNVPRLHIILQVELLTLFTSGLPFLLCSSFVLTLLIRQCRLVVLLFCSIVLHSQTYLRFELRTPCYVPFLVIVLVVPHNRLIIFPFRRYIHSHEYIYEQVMYDRISLYIDHSAPIARTSSLSVFSVFSGVFWNIFVNSVNSVTPKFETTRS